jgi:uncharacterized membrane protein YfcA
MNTTVLILLLLFTVAFLYSSVGHGGASGYLAVLSLMGISAVLMRPSALMLNIFVAGISFFQYYRSGHFRWKLFYPFAILSVPMAYLGSFVVLDPTLYKRVLGVCLILAVLRIIGVFNRKQENKTKNMPFVAGLVIGAALGFISGVIGIGGGILLSPVILLMNWGGLKETSAVSALFIVINSMAGMLGFWKQGLVLPPQIFFWLCAAIAGGLLGSYWGSQKAEHRTLKSVLAVVLLFAAAKLIVKG